MIRMRCVWACAGVGGWVGADGGRGGPRGQLTDLMNDPDTISRMMSQITPEMMDQVRGPGLWTR